MIQQGGQKVGVSYTQLAVGLVWLEHVCVAFLLALGGLLVVGIRVWTRLPWGLGGLWWL
jgi:hypothetical protein